MRISSTAIDNFPVILVTNAYEHFSLTGRSGAPTSVKNCHQTRIFVQVYFLKNQSFNTTTTELVSVDKTLIRSATVYKYRVVQELTHKNENPSTVSVSFVGHHAVHAAECFHWNSNTFLLIATHILSREPPVTST